MSGPLFRFTGNSGPHSVGFRVVEQYDYSRTYRSVHDHFGGGCIGERARPVQTAIWYPAARVRSSAMTVNDYVNLSATETSFGRPRSSHRVKELLSAMEPTLSMRLWAVRDAEAASGQFPVIIYAPGFSGMSWENADLCEYLASYGYVIVASPCMGAMTRNMTYDLDGINAQARDISFLIGNAHEIPNIELSRIAVVGFSWGAISNLFAATRDNRIGALVALDGSLRYSPGLVKRAGDVHPEQMTIPLLSFAQQGFSFEDQDRLLSEVERDGANVLNAWTHGDLINVRMLGLCHMEHSSMNQRNEYLWRKLFHMWPMMKGDYDREDGSVGYEWMARYTREFLDAYLKHEAASVDFLKRTPAKNGVPPHVLVANYRAATGVAPSFESFRAEIGRQGFAHAADIYANIRKGQLNFTIDEAVIECWANELIDDNHLTEALALLTLNIQIHPESSSAHASLGEAYRTSGQMELAIDSYRRALEKDPFNDDAAMKVMELGTSALAPDVTTIAR